MTSKKTVLIVAALVLVSVCGPASAVTKKPPRPDTYTQPQFFEWHQMTLDVLIVPPAHGQLVNGQSGPRVLNNGDVNEVNPLTTSYLKATLKAIADWKRAIQAFGSPSLKRLKLNVSVLGRDVPSSNALTDPDVLMTWDESKLAIGGITESPQFFTLGGQEHKVPCTISNSMWYGLSFSYSDMYNVAGHEFGHCLGIDHTTTSGKDANIARDLMHATNPDAIGSEKNPLHCMSNLNVAGIALAFDGKPTPTQATMPSTKYKRIAC